MSVSTALIAIIPELLGIGSAGLGGMQIAILLFSLGCLLVGMLLGRLDGRLLLVLATSGVAIAGTVMLLEILRADLGWTMWSLKNRVTGSPQLDLHRTDPILGWVNKPSQSVIDRHYDYTATYRTLDNDLTIINAGVNGWGSVQSLLLLEQLLDSEPRLAIVTYGFIPSHANRNSERESWLELIGLSDRKKPVLKERAGRLVFDRSIGVGEGKPPSETLGEQELQITLHCIETMGRLCREHHVRFYCLMLGADR